MNTQCKNIDYLRRTTRVAKFLVIHSQGLLERFPIWRHKTKTNLISTAIRRKKNITRGRREDKVKQPMRTKVKTANENAR